VAEPEVIILVEAFCEVNNVDISDQVTQVTVTKTADEVETSSMGTGGVKTGSHGLRSDTFKVEVFSDEQSDGLNSLFDGLLENETKFPVRVRPTADAISASNPEYFAQCKIFEFSGLDGGTGDAAKTTIELKAQQKIQRDVAATS
jgi:hypothetical protein